MNDNHDKNDGQAFPNSANSNSQAMSPEEVLHDYVRSGRNFFAQKKTAALYAASQAYLLWRNAACASAPQQARNWLREELAKVNVVIKGYNKTLRHDREKGLAVIAGKVTEEDLAGEGVTDTQTEKTRLTDLASVDETEFGKLLHVPIRVKEGDGDVTFNAVVRYMFELRLRSDAPQASRYATVLEWIEEKYGQEPDIGSEKIVDGIQEAGGFEAVLHARREQTGGGKRAAKKSGSKPVVKSSAHESDSVTEEDTEEFHRETITPIMRIPSWMQDLPEGANTLYCVCHDAEEIEVIGFDPLDEDKLPELRARFAQQATDDADNTVPGEGDQEQAAIEASTSENVT